MYFEGISFVCGVSVESHEAHTCYVVGGEGTEVLRFVVVLDDPVVDASHCLHKVSQSSSIVRSAFVDKLVIHEGPDAFILVHVRPVVEVDQSLAFELPGDVLVEVRHVAHGVSAVRVYL